MIRPLSASKTRKNKGVSPRCRCAKGEKHLQYYFSVNVEKKTKLMYLGKSKKAEAEEYSRNYELLWNIVEEMTLLNFELLKAKNL